MRNLFTEEPTRMRKMRTRERDLPHCGEFSLLSDWFPLDMKVVKKEKNIERILPRAACSMTLKPISYSSQACTNRNASIYAKTKSR